MVSSFPDTVIIVGAGVFGLSTALAIERRYPTTKVTVIDRYTPPVQDGTSVDTSRILRPGESLSCAVSETELTMNEIMSTRPMRNSLTRRKH